MRTHAYPAGRPCPGSVGLAPAVAGAEEKKNKEEDEEEEEKPKPASSPSTGAEAHAGQGQEMPCLFSQKLFFSHYKKKTDNLPGLSALALLFNWTAKLCFWTTGE